MRIWLLAIAVFLTSCAGTVHQDRFQPVNIPLVTFVFDDGNDTDLLIAKKIFAEHHAVACAAITTDWINTPYHMTPPQILELRDAGWEIMSHTVSHPRLAWSSPAKIDEELSQSKRTLEALGLRIKNLVYPYNNNDETVRMIASRYYRGARGSESSFNKEVADPHFLKSFSIKSDVTRVKKLIDTAHAEKTWLIFYHHEMDAKVKISHKLGTFQHGEELLLKPSGTVARYTTVHWFPVYGSYMYLVPFSGTPQPGDIITGSQSGATARIDYIMYDELALYSEALRYIRSEYPDMKIVTIDQGLDLLNVPDKKE